MRRKNKGDILSFKAARKKDATMLEKHLYLFTWNIFISWWKVQNGYLLKYTTTILLIRNPSKKILFLWIKSLGKKQKVTWKNDFYRLLNNPNFPYDCRNDKKYCVFEPIFEEMEELKCQKNTKTLLTKKNIAACKLRPSSGRNRTRLWLKKRQNINRWYISRDEIV